MDFMHGESFRQTVFFDGIFDLLDMRYTLDLLWEGKRDLKISLFLSPDTKP